MSTRALIGRSPIAVSRCCSQSGDGPFLTPRTSRSAKAGQSEGVAPKSSVTAHGAGKLALHRLDARVLELPHVSGGEIARDAVHAGAVGAVRRQVDLDHGIVEAGPLRVVRPDRRIVRQVDDAFVVVGNLQLEFGDQHAAALDAADGADGERHVLAGDEGAGRHEHALHAGARIGRAAHHLDRIAAAGIDHADAQPVGVGMLFGLDHARDDERRQELRLVLDALDLEPDHGELVDDLAERASVSRCSLSQPRVNFIMGEGPCRLRTIDRHARARPGHPCGIEACRKSA